MRKFLNIIAVSTLVFWASSCQKQLPDVLKEIDVVNKGEYQSHLKDLALSDYSDVSSDGDVFTKEFDNEDLANYSASSNQSWCVVTFDVKTSKMTVKVDANDTYESREATVTIQDTKDKTSRTFKVSQKQNNCIKTGENSYSVSTAGGQVVIDVESNVDYTVSIEKDCYWITLPNSSNGTRGLEKSTVVLEVSPNTYEKERSATVTLENTSTGDKAEILITQEFKAYFEISPKELTIGQESCDIKVYLKTNISTFDCYLTDGDNWLKKSGRESVDEFTVCQNLRVSAFTEKYASRTTTVTFENVSYGFSEAVTITQNHTLYIKEESVYLMAGESQQLSIYNNNLTNSVLWSSSDESVATVDDNGLVKGIAGGTAVIKLESSDGLYSDYVTVTVQIPTEQKADLSYAWSEEFTTFNGVTALSSLFCTLYNDSQYNIVLKGVTCYQDDEVIGYKSLNNIQGALNVGEMKKEGFDIPYDYGQHTYRFVWDYSLNGSNYSFTCFY